MSPEAVSLAKQAARRLKRAVAHRWRALTDARSKLLVLGYHRVLPQVGLNPFGTLMSVDTFVRQIEAVARRYPVRLLSEVMTRGPGSFRDGKGCAVLTFDDGYWDNYEIVFPLLKRRGIPATFFVSTDYIGAGGPLWDWELMTLMARCRDLRRVKIGDRVVEQRPAESRGGFALRVFKGLKSAPRGVQAGVLNDLRRHAGDGNAGPAPDDRCMTWEQVRAMRRAGMEIGSHAVSHRSLPRLSPHEALEEIRQSKLRVEQELGDRCLHFAFPFGSRRDYNDALIAAVREAGYATCALNVHGYHHLGDDLFALKRIIMLPSSNPATLLG
jgi:peptidoglycan/xylan/chitin deacetylase (PgdA/CDA1 family)